MNRARKIQALPQLVDTLVAESRTVYVFFADLCGSTQYKQNCKDQGQPDINWIIRQNVFLQRCADLVKKYDGVFVKTIGDEIFAYFEDTVDSENVLKCGIEIIQSFDNLRAYQDQSKIEAKVSIDIGETYNGAILDNVPYDPIGSPVDRCARLNDLAGNNEIICSSVFFDTMLGQDYKEDFLRIDELSQKYGFEYHEADLQGFASSGYFSMTAKFDETAL